MERSYQNKQYLLTGIIDSMSRCECYHETEEVSYLEYYSYPPIKKVTKAVGRCSGTKECDICNCGGDTNNCDFYESVRLKDSMNPPEPEPVNKDNVFDAIEGLIQFRHNWCLNVAETEKRDDLTFRCKECHFNDQIGGGCLIKIFIKKHGSQEQQERSQVIFR